MVPGSSGLIRPIPGLPEEACIRIAAVFENCVGLGRAVLYGSRAKGTQKSNSDIDLAVWGIVSAETLAMDLEELPLPWAFDVRAYEGIRSAALRQHIDRVGLEIWTRGI